MDWLKPLIPLLQSGLQVYMSGQLIKKTSANAKHVAVQSSVIAFGSLAFLIFLTASIIMFFVDLGNQFESHNGIHFSGMMLSCLMLTGLGVVAFGICFGIARYLASKETQKRAEAQPEAKPYAALVLFGEELLKQLAKNLSQGEKEKEEKADED